MILRTPLAEQDLDDIWDYIALDSPKEADKFLHTIAETLKSIENMPLMGRERPELLNNLRSFPIGNYSAFISSHR